MEQARTLLLASDLTARSDRPTDRALLLGDQLSASVLLLHVVEDEDAGAQLEDRADRALETVIGSAADRVEILVRSGRVDREILKVAEECSPVLIVTGAARFNSVRDYVLGTAVDHLVRHSPVPVLVVKRRAREPYRRLLVATDFSDCSRQALKTAAALFPEAAITLWHSCHAAYEGFLDAEETGSAIKEEADLDMQRFADGASLSAETRERVTQQVDVGRDLWSRAETTLLEGAFDLLVLGTHGRGGFAHATIGSRAAELLQCAGCDVLMVRSSSQQQAD